MHVFAKYWLMDLLNFFSWEDAVIECLLDGKSSFLCFPLKGRWSMWAIIVRTSQGSFEIETIQELSWVMVLNLLWCWCFRLILVGRWFYLCCVWLALSVSKSSFFWEEPAVWNRLVMWEWSGSWKCCYLQRYEHTTPSASSFQYKDASISSPQQYQLH